MRVALGQLLPVRVSGPEGKLGDAGGDVRDSPVPEVAAGGGIRVVARHGEARGLRRESLPLAVRRLVFAASPMIPLTCGVGSGTPSLMSSLVSVNKGTVGRKSYGVGGWIADSFTRSARLV